VVASNLCGNHVLRCFHSSQVCHQERRYSSGISRTFSAVGPVVSWAYLSVASVSSGSDRGSGHWPWRCWCHGCCAGWWASTDGVVHSVIFGIVAACCAVLYEHGVSQNCPCRITVAICSTCWLRALSQRSVPNLSLVHALSLSVGT